MQVVIVNANNVDYTYIEPAINADGTPLTDLKETVLWAQVQGQSIPASIAVRNASTPTGGVEQRVSAILPVLVNEQKDVTCWVTARDTSGNMSEPSLPVTIRIDRLAPAPPL